MAKKDTLPQCGMSECKKRVGPDWRARDRGLCGFHWEIVRTVELYLQQYAKIQQELAEEAAKAAEYKAPDAPQLELPTGVTGL